MMQTAIPDLSPLPEYGDHLTLDDFADSVACELFTEYDGTGYYATENAMTDIEVSISDIRDGIVDKRWTHIMWFNK